jgi:hypothetical protein
MNDDKYSSDSAKRKDAGIEVIAHSLMVPIIADAAAATKTVSEIGTAFGLKLKGYLPIASTVVASHTPARL